MGTVGREKEGWQRSKREGGRETRRKDRRSRRMRQRWRMKDEGDRSSLLFFPSVLLLSLGSTAAFAWDPTHPSWSSILHVEINLTWPVFPYSIDSSDITWFHLISSRYRTPDARYELRWSWLGVNLFWITRLEMKFSWTTLNPDRSYTSGWWESLVSS